MVNLELSEEISKHIFWQFRHNGFENEEIVVEVDLACGVQRVSESFNEVESSIDKDLTFVHFVTENSYRYGYANVNVNDY